MVRFPQALRTATVHATRVLINSTISDDELVEYMQWKTHHRIDIVTPARLRALFRSGVEKNEIRQLFKNNNKYGYLTQDFKRRKRVQCSQ